MTRAAQAVIDLDALQHNLRKVREAATGRRVMAVIKADGYGHGILNVARALNDADAFAVACFDEAVTLREAGATLPIVLLEGFFSPEEITSLTLHGFSCVVHHMYQLELLERASLRGSLPVWIKLDTGMHRLGFPPEDASTVHRRLSHCAGVSVVGFMTHLANADDPRDEATRCQLGKFNKALVNLPGERSVANSAGLLAWPETQSDWVRPGIMLYGVSPFAGQTGTDLGLKPVMTLQSQLISIQPRSKGDRIGYGGDYVCPKDTMVGVVAIGYGDGYPRHAVSGTPVLVNGRRVPLVGRVSMDMICVDLGAQREARCGDMVCLWGSGLPVEEIAAAASTIPYELLCRVTARVPRHPRWLSSRRN